MDVIKVPTGHILTFQGSVINVKNSQLECLSIGDYGKEANMFARFLGLTKRIDTVAHTDMLSLGEKWVITISTQYGCSMNCTFCDVPKVGPGINASYNDMMAQVLHARDIHPEIKHGERLNIHFARMGEPTWNADVLSAAYMFKMRYGKQFKTVHPVVSTMMPKKNEGLFDFLKAWMFLKNTYYKGEAGLQLSINSTDDWERAEMFNYNTMNLWNLSVLMAAVVKEYGIVGRKITLNFALGNYTIDVNKLRSFFDPRHFLIKLTPMHITHAVVENEVKWQQDPYPLEAELSAAGYDVIVFIPSEEEDKGRITCGNALLSGSKPEI